MMYFKTIMFIGVVVALLVQFSVAFQLTTTKTYVFRNRADDTYLTAVNNEVECKRRGSVLTTRNISHSKEAQEWTFYGYEHGKDHQTLFFIGSYNNEVTFKKKEYCYLMLEAYTIIPFGFYDIQIESIEKKKCLTGMGIGKAISWQPCRKTKSRSFAKQLWYLDGRELNQKLAFVANYKLN